MPLCPCSLLLCTGKPLLALQCTLLFIEHAPAFRATTQSSPEVQGIEQLKWKGNLCYQNTADLSLPLPRPLQFFLLWVIAFAHTECLSLEKYMNFSMSLWDRLQIAFLERFVFHTVSVKNDLQLYITGTHLNWQMGMCARAPLSVCFKIKISSENIQRLDMKMWTVAPKPVWSFLTEGVFGGA